MSRLNVNPTRMQLKSLQSRLKIAVKGHKLLKDKSDELIRQYSSLIKQNYVLRKKVEESVRLLLSSFCQAKGYMSIPQVLSTFLNKNENVFESTFKEKNILNLSVPDVSVSYKNENSSSENQNSLIDLPYSFVSTNIEFDFLARKCEEVVPDLIKLSNIEKTCQILAFDILHTKRRVNALEFIMIPQLEETIKYISMKIEENDRSSRIRLIKVKSIMQGK